ncbi:hypothetical protein VP395_01435 [Mariniflexile soesokkakense]|uniref:DUF4825 domain-containing protein n=1 Tax=Mariniflexile soesokkakense TaxID=1343160 RepID=A0ABV0A629_9FLAO
MKKTLAISLILVFGFYSCESDKKFSDFNEDDFYEVQGILDYVGQNNNPFDSRSIKNVSFTYFLDRSTHKKGSEKNLDLNEIEYILRPYDIQNGYPLIVLVHKDDENISFYGQVGILENLNENEKGFLTKHLRKEMDKLKKKIPEYIYSALIKDTIK